MTSLGAPVLPAEMHRPVFDHLLRMTDGFGLFEHALHDNPRPEHGYCLDDVARGLIVVCRQPVPARAVRRLGRGYLDFVLAATDPSGMCHNRMSIDGRWSDEPAMGDWWGRAVWSLGVAAAGAPTPAMRARALSGFRVCAQQRCEHTHAMSYAALGCAELLRRQPDEMAARALLRDAISVIGEPGDDPGWPWPAPRLSYGSAAMAEALIVGGEALEDGRTQAHGLTMLSFLLDLETRDGHLSVTPVGGRSAADTAAGFDQQPIEVAALSDACASAYRVTGDARWLAAVHLAWGWFLGDNDGAVPMFDSRTGGGYDGLESDGHNRNQGAESTLAMLSTAQHAYRLRSRTADRLRWQGTYRP